MKTEVKLRIAALLVAAGLLIQMLSLLPLHPLAFIAFVGLGAPVMVAGVVFFLLSLVSQTGQQRPVELQSERNSG